MNTKTFLEDGGAARALPSRATARTRSGDALTRIRVWDLPTRLFHWSLVAAVTVAIVTGEIGGSLMPIHAKAGLAIFGLVAFRLVWGFVGSTHARFLNFVPTAGRIKAYLKGRWQGEGHNPLGAFSVFALLGLLAVQAGTGLFGNDDIAFTGPLYALIDEDFALKLTGLHRQLANVLLVLTALHVVAIFIYVVLKKNNLIKPMVTGWKDVRHGSSARQGSVAGLIVAVLVAVVVVYLASGASLHKDAPPASQPQSQPLSSHAAAPAALPTAPPAW